jgi:hypothetical protein
MRCLSLLLVVLPLAEVKPIGQHEGLPLAWASEPMVISSKEVRSVVEHEGSDDTIRLKKRPVVLQRKSKTNPWELDAGACVIEKKSGNVGCLPSFVIIGMVSFGCSPSGRG